MFYPILCALFAGRRLILLEGQMGAGKTTFTRALVAAMGGNPDAVSSPSYALMNGYEASLPIWHIDAWRMSSDEDFDNLGLDDFGEGAGAHRMAVTHSQPRRFTRCLAHRTDRDVRV